MKVFIVRSLEVLCYLGFFGFIIGGSVLFYLSIGHATVPVPNPVFTRVMAVVAGALAGFIAAVIVFGTLFLLLDIADNTRRTRELLERRP